MGSWGLLGAFSWEWGFWPKMAKMAQAAAALAVAERVKERVIAADGGGAPYPPETFARKPRLPILHHGVVRVPGPARG